MRFNVTTDFNFHDETFPTVKTLLIRIGKILGSNIQLRTLNRGVDADGKKFKPYSKAYKAFKTARGGNPTPDLKSVRKVSEHMVESVDIVKTQDRLVEVGVSGFNMKKAIWNEGTGRFFLGYYEKEDDKDINKIIDDWVEESLNRYL